MTIRAKLFIVSLVLTVAVVGMGAYGVYGVNRISALMTQTYDRAMMASIHAEQAHTNFIKVDRAVRDAVASRTVDEFDRFIEAADSAAADVLSDLDVVAERTWSQESAKLVVEITALVREKQTLRAAIIPNLREQLSAGGALPAVRSESAPRTARTAPAAVEPASPAAAPASPAAAKAPAEDSGVQIIKRKKGDGASPVAAPVREVAVVAPTPAPVAGATPKADESKAAPRIAQVGAVASTARLSSATPRVSQVAGITSAAVDEGASRQEATVVARPVPTGAVGAASLFQGSEEIEAKLRALADRAAEAGYVFRESSRKISHTILGVTIGALITAIVIIGAVVVMFGRWIANPLRQVIHRLHGLIVGGGTLEHRLSTIEELPVQSADEIGQLRASFNATVGLLRKREAEVKRELRHEELQENIFKFLNVAHEIAQGDLTKRGAVTDDVLGSVVDAINVMVQQIGTIIGDVRNAARLVSSNANDMVVAMTQTSSGAQAQSSETMKVASAVEQLSLSVRQVADSATASARAAHQTLEAAQKGDEAIKKNLEGMEAIRGEAQAISKKIKGLADRSLEISDIVNTIEEIAKHTNVLAVTAAIEASEAGEVGVRFSAVAVQVRMLAERSAKAARDIVTLIKRIQTETRDAVLAVEEGTNQVESGHALSLETGASLQEIAAISRTSAELAHEISLATKQQVRGVDGVAAAMQSIAAVAVQTEQGMREARKTVDEMGRLAEHLHAKLAQFRVAAA
jgi:methyl-accepting chemotaxis protein